MSYINELLVCGYVHYIIEHEFFFRTIIILPRCINRTILSYLPKAKKLKIPVTMGPCMVSAHNNKKYTMYTFRLNINDETHSFTARYSSLLEFHNSLFKDKEIQRSFGHNLPAFPPKKWWLDFTKPENYSKRAHKLLKYFQLITKHESVLKNHIFQNGIYLPLTMRRLISDTVRGYYWPPLPKLPSPTVSPEPPDDDGIPVLPPPTDWPLTFEDKLNNLLKETDKAMIDINVGNGIRNGWYGDVMDEINQSYWFIDDMDIFYVKDILPKCLLNDDNSKKIIENETEKMEMNDTFKLFETMSIRENEEINEVVLGLRDAILESCDITVVN
mmetsp:Transcript_58770/g.52952  ORF Transcript_58770/g.52952 Transcript_58770/m.52952 type:complete len:329 (+) Transcript_58770:42-1028(+)